MPELIRAVAYYRKSNEDDGNSVEQQREWAHQAAARESVQIVREFTDQAKPGWDTANRTDFHEMLRFCQEQRRAGTPIGAVLCWNANRFSRADSQETAWFIWEFRKAGTGRMLTATRWIDFARMEDRLLFNIEQDTSHHPYVINQSRDATRGRIKAARKGQYLGGPVPYAYRLVADADGRKRLVPGPEQEIETVRFIFRTYADTKLGIRGVAAAVSRRGVPSPSGKPFWNPNTVQEILTHPAYLGYAVWNRRSEGRFFAVVDCQAAERPLDAGARANPPEQWIWGEQRHESLIDLDTFERCGAKLASRRGGKCAPRAAFLLSGLLRCGHCGRALIGRTRRWRKRGKAYTTRDYLCNGYNLYGTHVCKRNGVNADALERAVLRKLEALAQDFLAPGNVEALRAEIARQDAAEQGRGAGDEKRLRARLADLERKVKQAAGRVLDEEDPRLVPELRAALKARQDERDSAAAELEAAGARPSPAADLEADVDAAVAVMGRLVESLREGDAEALRAVLVEMVSYVELWFRHEPHGTRTRCHYARGLVYRRQDRRLEVHERPTRIVAS